MSQELKQGSLLDHGKYKVERVLGQGGFGITYLVTDIGLDKKRAIKEFFPKDFCQRDDTTSHISLGTNNTADFVDRLKKKFIKEARNIANLDQHNGIIRIHTVFEENNTAYYVMDYIEGESLSSLVKRFGPLTVDKAINYVKQIGESLGYVHFHNINHLDIKPANIMIRKKDDKAILIDFGLAKQYDAEGQQTSTTPTGISHGFAPLEQYKSGGVSSFSPQTDIYSLAATLYYLVSGTVPPHATDIINEGMTFPIGFPNVLKSPILKAMSTRKLERPATVNHFLKSLNGLKEDETEVINISVEREKKPIQTQQPGHPVNINSEKKQDKVLQDNSQRIRTRENRYNDPLYIPKESKTPNKVQSTKFPKIFTRSILFLCLIIGIITFIILLNDDKIKYEVFEEYIHTAKLVDGKKAKGQINIPSYVKLKHSEYKVVEIADGAFSYNKELISVTLPPTVTKIGDDAFTFCSKLSSVYIPNSVVSIGSSAFSFCNIEIITIPSSVTFIGDNAFYACDRLRTVYMPSMFETRKYSIFGGQSHKINFIWTDKEIN